MISRRRNMPRRASSRMAEKRTGGGSLPLVAAWKASGQTLGRLFLAFVLALATAFPLSVVEGFTASIMVEGTSEAYAAVGTSNYKDIFHCEQKSGTPGKIVGSTLTYGSSSESVTSNLPYAYVPTNDATSVWESSAFFFTNDKLPLTFDWEISFSAIQSGLNYEVGKHKMVLSAIQVGLSAEQSAAKLKGPFIAQVFQRDGDEITNVMRTVTMLNGFAASFLSESDIARPSGPPFTYGSTFRYKYSTDTLTYISNRESASISQVRDKLGSSSAYLCFGGRLQWRNDSQPAADKHPSNMYGTITFNSITLPHLDPAIESISLYDATTGKPINANGNVAPGTRIKVEVKVWNKNASAGSESFNMHFLPSTTLTKNFTPDSSKSAFVNGQSSGKPITVFGGIPITLTGRTPVTISYEGTVGANTRIDTIIGADLKEDIFGGIVSDSAKALDAQTLVQGPGTGLTPGSGYHFTRLPAANANGWNNSPVTVSFFAGDYDRFSISPQAGGAAVSTLSGTSSWTESDDVDSLAVRYQASKSSTGLASTTADDVIRIDTTEPTLSLNRATKTLTVDDSASARAAGVSSGVWKLYATDASGTPASTVNTFTLTDGKGAVTQTVPNVAEGYYVAEDAAGNRSAPFLVKDSSAPTAGRPEGSGLPEPEPPSETTDGAGLKHAVYEETITRVIDADNPAFGGSLDLDDAKALAGERWTFASSEGDPLTGTTELLDAAGATSIASLPTNVPGECLIRTVATDADGNTATANIHYRFVAPQIPTLTPQGPSDPDDPDSPKVPTGDPVKPPVPPTLGPDGTQSGELNVQVQERVREGSLPVVDAASVLTEHFALGSAAGDEPTVTVDGATDAAGNPVEAIDLAVPAIYQVEYTLTDAAGNTTKVHLTYVLQESVTPPDPPGPVDPVDPNPPVDPKPEEPVDPKPPTPSTPDTPKPVPTPPTVTVVPDGGGAPTVLKPTPSTVTPGDGLTHVTVSDELVVAVRDVRMSPDDFAALFAKRYQVASAQSDGKLTAGDVAIYDESGRPLGEVDRSHEGRYVVEQVFTDSAGNTTTVRLTYIVREESAVGTLNSGTGGAGADADASKGAASTRVSTTALPQTGPFGTLCPLHPLFVALAAVAALYTAARLRQEAASRGKLKSRDEWVREQVLEGDAAEVAVARAIWGDPEPFAPEARWRADDASGARRLRLGVLDGAVLALVAATALVIALSPQCAYDGPLALLVCGLCLLCAAMIQLSLGSTARTRRRCWLVEWAREVDLL